MNSIDYTHWTSIKILSQTYYTTNTILYLYFGMSTNWSVYFEVLKNNSTNR